MAPSKGEWEIDPAQWLSNWVVRRQVYGRKEKMIIKQWCTTDSAKLSSQDAHHLEGLPCGPSDSANPSTST